MYVYDIMIYKVKLLERTLTCLCMYLEFGNIPGG